MEVRDVIVCEYHGGRPQNVPFPMEDIRQWLMRHPLTCVIEIE